jgi:4-amino-4-deoxy-L-arabinose transferase-like glycosyltransferase
MTRKAFLKLLPILILYFLVFMLLADKSLEWGDQSRYTMYAQNLTKGFYAPHDTLLLWNGPGYPLFLMPFAYFKIPWFYAKMLNPVIMFLTVCFVFVILRNYTSEKMSLFFSYIFGLYPPFYAEMQYLLTDPFVRLLVVVFAMFLMKWFKTGRYRYMFWAGVFCAFTALTKVFFGYVVLAMLLLGLIGAKWNVVCRKIAPVYGLGLLFCVPYLIYTYSLTGKIFYWANSSGPVAYWITNPYSDEYGDWKSEVEVATVPQLYRHKEFFDKLATVDFMKQDEMLKKQAMENIVRHPAKMLYNWVANVSRLFLNFPYSYKYQNPVQLLYLVPGALLLIAALFCVYPLVKFRRGLPPEIIHAIIVSLVFTAGHSLVYAQARFLCIIVPFIFIVIAYTVTNLVKVEL